MLDRRPKNINPLSIKLPITALVSIGHRISGVFVFLCIPLMLCALAESLRSQESFEAIASWFSPMPVKILTWLLIVAVVFHLLAGFRHLLMDCHWGETLRSAKLTAGIVIVITVAAAVLFGICLLGS